MKKLILPIKRKYFDEILSGEKKQEYRECKLYWKKRLINKTYDHVEFVNGYSKKANKIIFKYNGYELKKIRHEFFGNEIVEVFNIKIGEKINLE